MAFELTEELESLCKAKKIFEEEQIKKELANILRNCVESTDLKFENNKTIIEPTLIEKYGYDIINEELEKRSNYYNKEILGESYIEMITSSGENKIENIIN